MPGAGRKGLARRRRVCRSGLASRHRPLPLPLLRLTLPLALTSRFLAPSRRRRDDRFDRDIRVRLRAQGNRSDVQFLRDSHSAYDPLHFTLLHPRGELGWDQDLLKGPKLNQTRAPAAADLIDDEAGGGGGDGGGGRGANTKITARQYCAFFMHDRVPGMPTCYNSSSTPAASFKSGW
jgi:hypothetical protein